MEGGEKGQLCVRSLSRARAPRETHADSARVRQSHGSACVPVLLLLAVACCMVPCGAPRVGDREQVVLDALRAHAGARERPAEVGEALARIVATQRAALGDMQRARFLFLRMNAAAGLGNRLVAMVSGLMLAAATERALLIEWEEYSAPRVHRSKEVSTMVPMDVFFQLPFSCDAAAVLGTVELQRVFGWDYQYWRNMNDEDPADMKVLLSDGIRSAFQERVVTISAISYFGDLLLANPAAESGGGGGSVLAGLKVGRRPFMHTARFLLRPSEAVQDAVDSFYLEHMAGRNVVAVHLRTIEYMTMHEQRTALRFAHFLAQGSAASVFVASDTAAGMQLAEAQLGAAFLRLQAVEPGRAGKQALVEGWANMLLLSRAQAIVGTSRSSYALLAAGLAGTSADSRPFYDVYGSECVKVVCTMPVIQRDHPLAKAGLLPAYNVTCLSPSLRVRMHQP